ncbi:MAG: fibronectin type III domain-containing protein [Flavobacterium sp.]
MKKTTLLLLFFFSIASFAGYSNVKGEYFLVCSVPTNATVSNIGVTTATLNWNSTGDKTEYYVSKVNTTPLVTTTPTGSITTGTSSLITSLAPSTKYFVWVRANCGNETFSDWSAPITFTTLACDTAVTNLYESFEDVTTPNLPSCWTKIIKGAKVASSAYVRTENSNSNSYSAPNSVSLNNATSTGTYDIILVSPKLSNIASDSYRLRFYAKSNTDNLALEIGTLNSNANDAVFKSVSSVFVKQTYAEYIVQFNTHSTDSYIGIRLNPTDTYQQANIDNISWELIPTCPDVKEIYAPVVTENSVDLMWTEGDAGVNSYDIAITGNSVNNPSQIDTFLNTTLQKITIDDLKSATDYKVWVRSVCSASKGNWMGPVTIKTSCLSTTILEEKFDSVTVGELPACWSKVLRGETLSPSAYIKTISALDSGVNALVLHNSGSTKGSQYNIIAVSPNMSNIHSGLYRLKFKARCVGTSDNLVLQVGTLNTDTNFAEFNVVESVTLSGNTYKQYIVNFSSTDGTDKHIGFRFDENNLTYKTIYIDDISWELIPLCADVSGIKITDLTETEAGLNWSKAENETTWNVSVRPVTATSADNVNYETVQDITSFNIENLKPATTYKVWVRSVCGTDKFGYWMGPITFTTACPTIEDFSEDFEETTMPNLPVCWTKILRADKEAPSSKMEGVIETTDDFGDPYLGKTKGVFMKNFGSNNNYDVILASPRLANLSAGTYRLKFAVRGNINQLQIEVGTMDNTTDSGVFTKYDVVPAPMKTKEYVINFTSNILGGNHIAFRVSPKRMDDQANSYTILYLDNIVWELIPLCPDVEGLNVSYTTTETASIGWTAGSESKWEVVIAPEDITSPEGLTSTIVEGNAIHTVDKLDPATVYKAWVRTVCDGIRGSGYWSKPLKFITQCLPVSTFSEDFKSTTFPNLPMCWNKILRNGPAIDSDIYVGTNPTNHMEIYAGKSEVTADVILACPSIHTASLEANVLKFKGEASNPIQIGFLNNNSKEAIFTPVVTFNPDQMGKSKELTVDFSGKYEGNITEIFIGIRLATGTTLTSSQYAALYDMTWLPKPTDPVVTDPILSDEQFNLSNFNYYPNPVKDVLNISYQDTISNVTIYNILGQEMLRKSVNASSAIIDMSSLVNGSYLVKINSNDLIKTIKVVKQ